MAPSIAPDYEAAFSQIEHKQSNANLKTNFVLQDAHGPLCWRGKHLSEQEYVLCLEKADIKEAERAGREYESAPQVNSRNKGHG